MVPIPTSNGVHVGMPLTEYSANPTSEKTAASSSVPGAFLLPDGHPDVSKSFRRSLDFINEMLIVSPPHTHFPSL